jgi:hypothetical protein
MAITGLINLCTPAYIYLTISLIALIIMSIQNAGNVNMFCLGTYSCDVPSIGLIFVIKLIYILFWTWILNLMCKAGAETLSWIFVLLPFVLFFGVLFYMLFL